MCTCMCVYSFTFCTMWIHTHTHSHIFFLVVHLRFSHWFLSTYIVSVFIVYCIYCRPFLLFDHRPLNSSTERRRFLFGEHIVVLMLMLLSLLRVSFVASSWLGCNFSHVPSQALPFHTEILFIVLWWEFWGRSPQCPCHPLATLTQTQMSPIVHVFPNSGVPFFFF